MTWPLRGYFEAAVTGGYGRPGLWRRADRGLFSLWMPGSESGVAQGEGVFDLLQTARGRMPFRGASAAHALPAASSLRDTLPSHGGPGSEGNRPRRNWGGLMVHFHSSRLHLLVFLMLFYTYYGFGYRTLFKP